MKRIALASALLAAGCSAVLDFGAFRVGVDASQGDGAAEAGADVAADVSGDVPGGFDASPDAGPDATSDVGGDLPADRVDGGSALVPPSPVAQVVTGLGHTCARLEDGRVFCWGANEWGQLGAGTSVPMSTTPVAAAITDVAELASGAYHVCARTRAGAVMCWGRNDTSQLGDGSRDARTSPTAVIGLEASAWQLAAGAAHTCATSESVTVCWGSNAEGQCGVAGGAMAYARPTPVPGVRALRVAAGERFTCAHDDTGVWCWGSNEYRQLGRQAVTSASDATPTRVPLTLAAGERVTHAATGGFHACARTSTGRWLCWGRGDFGGVPGTTLDTVPMATEVPQVRDQSLALGGVSQCAVGPSGSLRCWGDNTFGQLGDGARSRALTPPAAAVLDNVARDADNNPVVAVGMHHVCALTRDGVLRCWGARATGGLGDGLAALFATPNAVPGLRNVTDIAAGSQHTCVTVAEGATQRVECFGYNHVGQLGARSDTVQPSPVPVRDGTPDGAPLRGQLAQLVAGVNHACVLVGNTPRCWGFESQGQTGGGMALSRGTFAAIGAPMGVTSASVLAAGAAHSAAAANATVSCWGANASWQCGDSTGRELALTPVTVPQTLAFNDRVTSLAAGELHTCMSTMTGRVYCWGGDVFGQAGVPPVQRAAPSLVADVEWRVGPALTAGSLHTCAWNSDAVWCWGANNRGQSAPSRVGTASHRPEPVPGLTMVQHAAAGSEHTCAATVAGVACWGANFRGQLGVDRVTDHENTLQRLTLPRPVRKLTAGAFHTCALLDDGTVSCWGSNQFGQLGTPQRVALDTPSTAGVRWR